MFVSASIVAIAFSRAWFVGLGVSCGLGTLVAGKLIGGKLIGGRSMSLMFGAGIGDGVEIGRVGSWRGVFVGSGVTVAGGDVDQCVGVAVGGVVAVDVGPGVFVAAGGVVAVGVIVGDGVIAGSVVAVGGGVLVGAGVLVGVGVGAGGGGSGQAGSSPHCGSMYRSK